MTTPKPTMPQDGSTIPQQGWNHTMAACLLVMDDTIKLSEWLAYHYAILPLGTLVVAIDPHSQDPGKIRDVLERWKPFIDITIWTEDTWMEIGPEEWWPGNDAHPEKGARLKEHRRRQRTFAFSCMRHFKQQDRDWTLLTDTDEFLVYNYPHPSEDYTLYDTAGRGHWKAEIDREREAVRSIRQSLPSLVDTPIRTFLDMHMSNQKCLHIPGLSYSSIESSSEEIARDLPAIVTNPEHLMTVRHRKHAKKHVGTFSKALVNLKHISYEKIDMGHVKSIHNPTTILCGTNGKFGSGKDYISATLRLNHYVGTAESFLERSGDVRRKHLSTANLEEKNKQLGPVEVDDDIRPWLTALVKVLGEKQVEQLLLDPLRISYTTNIERENISNDVKESRS